MMKRWFWVAIAAGLLVRIPAITALPIDWDEPIYMAAAQALNQGVRDGDWGALFDPQVNPEHPGLVKCIFAFGFSLFGAEPSLIERVMVVRGMSLLAGIGLVALAARVHPVAGLALAMHTIHAKYSCQGYLDAIPAGLMALAMLYGWKHRRSSSTKSVLVCSVLWGAAIAGKWIHGVPGVVLLAMCKGHGTRTKLLIATLGFAWLLDPTAWFHPVERVEMMLKLHREYALTVPGSTMWSPWLFLGEGGPAEWHPDVFYWSIDFVWLFLGMVGMAMSFRTSWGRFLTAWFFVPMIVFMVWDTRWPQHLMVVLMPLCLAIVEAVRPILSRANHHFGPTGSPQPTFE